jgi:hypothetical protein
VLLLLLELLLLELLLLLLALSAMLRAVNSCCKMPLLSLPRSSTLLPPCSVLSSR